MEQQRITIGLTPPEKFSDKANRIKNKSHEIKTLGQTRPPLEDHFVYACITPVLIVDKVIIWWCWKLDIEWNDAVPDDVSRAYTNFKDDIGSLSQFITPQKVLLTHLYDEPSLPVFCDASEKAYGACVYLVSVHNDIVS